MAKKKRKKSSKNFFSGIFSLIGGTFRLLLKVTPVVAIALIIGFGFFGVKKALYADSALSIQKIVITPNDSLPASKQQQVESKWLGKNILKLDLKKIAKDLEQDPNVRVAEVTRHLPAILKVEIQKRTAAVYIQLAPRGLYGVISEDGVILDVVKESNPSLVLIEAYGGDQKEPKTGMRVKQRGYSEAIKFLKAFWNHALSRRETVSKMSLDHLGNLTIFLGGGPEVRLGRHPSDRLEAFERIETLLEKESRTQIEYVDLQFDNVIVKRKK